MNTKMRLDCIQDIQMVQSIANEFPEQVSMISEDGTVIIDAKTFIGLFALNFETPVTLVCENEKFHKKLKKELATRIVE